MLFSMKSKLLHILFIGLLILLFADSKAFTQVPLNKEISLNIYGQEIIKVLTILEQQAKTSFAYSTAELELTNKVSIHVQQKPLSYVLDLLLHNTAFTYSQSGEVIVLYKKPTFTGETSNNNVELIKSPIQANIPPPIVISGRILDENGNGLSGVNIVYKGGISGTTSTDNGRYSFRVPSDAGILVISYVGFVSQEVAIDGRSTINFTLSPDAKSLSNIVVVGFGTQRKEKVIGSIAQVGAKEIENRPVTQLQNVLTGQLAGVTVTQRNGRPGATSGAISVRGVGSFGASADALILVDGIPVGGFNDIDPNDVETISVLKDASSAAIYGARAANGVILVTTKSGKAGKTQISYSGYTGFQKPTALPQFVNSWEYQQAVFEATNATASPTGVATLTTEQLAILAKYKAQNDPDYPNTNFINSVITKKGIQTGHNITVSGGTPANKYNLSAGYLFQDGLVIDNSYSRYNVRLNLNTVLSPKFDLTTRIASIIGVVKEPYVPAGVNQSDLTDIIDQSVRVPSNFVGRYPNGDFGLGINLFGTPVSYLASESFRKQKNININGNTRLDYKPFRGFKTSFVASYVQNSGRETQFRSTQRLNPSVTLGPNQLTELANNNYYYTLQFLAEYTKQIGKHQLNFLGGYSFEKNTAENFNAFRDNLPGNNLTVLSVGSPGNQQTNGTGSIYALESQFARVNYSYNNKYLFESVIRRDGSSRFPTNNKYAYFPSVAVGWRISQESFIRDQFPWINELKIRASRGLLGNQNLGNNYPYQNTLITSSANSGGTLYSFGGIIAQGVTRSRLTDPNLHWESTRTTDIGFEGSLFKNKLTFSATYFDRYTYDILYSPNSSVSNVLGFQISATNTGRLRNSGYEFTAGHNNTIGKFSYNINGNLTILENKVLDLGVGNVKQPNGLVGNGSNLFIGYPGATNNYGLYYGFVADGLFASQDDIAKWPNMTTVNPNVKPGDIRYRDISGPNGEPDGKVDNTYDRVVLGSQIPKYSYGINIGASFGGFDFTTLLQGLAGVKGFLNGAFGYALLNQGNVQRWQYDGRWTAENPNANATYPRIENITNSGTSNSVVSSFWVINGAYLRIKNVQAGYSLSKAVLQRMKLSKLRLYVSGENLHTFSHYRKGWDPEVNTGATFYPIITNYTIGINVIF